MAETLFPSPAALELVHLTLQAVRFSVTDEIALHSEIEAALRSKFDHVEREVRLDRKNRIDFIVSIAECRVGIEVKVKGAKRAIFRQLERYATFPATVCALSLPGAGSGHHHHDWSAVAHG